MQFNRSHQIWKAAAPDETRPILNHVLIERTRNEVGIAVAANGFVLAVIPVVLDEDDVPGIVRADLFQRAASMTEIVKGKRTRPASARMGLGADRVTLADESTHLRTSFKNDNPPYPDWRRIAKRTPAKEGSLVGEIGLDPRWLAIMGAVLGVGKDVQGLRLTFNGRESAVMIERVQRFGDLEAEPPYGLVMPMHITARLRAEKEGAA